MDDFYTIEEMASLLGIKKITLQCRLSRGKDHPPFFGRGKGVRFPKELFRQWAKGQLVFEVKVS
jgi:excisionase family DNA binding protein